MKTPHPEPVYSCQAAAEPLRREQDLVSEPLGLVSRASKAVLLQDKCLSTVVNLAMRYRSFRSLTDTSAFSCTSYSFLPQWQRLRHSSQTSQAGAWRPSILTQMLSQWLLASATQPPLHCDSVAAALTTRLSCPLHLYSWFLFFFRVSVANSKVNRSF